MSEKKIKDYPLFIPPENLSRTAKQEWSLKEARQYRDWLIEELDGRVDRLLDTFEVKVYDEPKLVLIDVGKKVEELIPNELFSENSNDGKVLTNRGRSLAADMGLLVAKILLNEYGTKLRWEIVRKPKSDMSYNLPVLEGFSNGNYLDPVGGSIAEASGILRRNKSFEIWAVSYEFWSKLVE